MIGHRPHNTALFTAIAIVVFFGSIFPGSFYNPEVLAQTPASRPPKIFEEISYIEKTGAKASRSQTLDLYLPAGTRTKPPLLVFLHGGYWTASDDEYRIGPLIGDALSAKNVAVALVRYRLAPTHRHPAQANDVAAAVAYLLEKAGQYGYDPKRIFLSGHSVGAHLAALVALDSSYLSKHRLSPQSLAGVIAFSGIYDLVGKTRISDHEKAAVAMTFGNKRTTLKEASPVTHARAQAPPFLILTAHDDLDGFRVDARKFADALRAAGHQHVEQYIMPDRDHYSMIILTGEYKEVLNLLLAFLKVKPLPPEMQELIDAKRKWISPPVSTAPFWRHKELIRSYPIDKRFVESLIYAYGPQKHELLEWPLEKYYAIDLFSYVDSLPKAKIGRGNYLITTNLRSEKQFWSRKQVEQYKPVIVVGIDDEQNLYRFGVFYRALREYSWKPGPRPPMMARPLGAFIHFLKEPPVELRPQPSQFALTTESFQLVENDPLKPLRAIPKDVYEVLTYRNGCVYCHSFRGTGSRSHHILMSSATPHGGYAMPLENYPPDVWKAFVFYQEEVAAKIGASPNTIQKTLRQAVHDLVAEHRQGRRTSGK